MIRILLLMIVLTAGSIAADAQSVSGSIGKAVRGRIASGTVVLNIPPGYHVNSNRPSSENLIPTTVSITSDAGRVVLGKYPPGRNKRFPFSDDPLNVYVGRVKFNFTIPIPRNYRRSTLTLRVAVSFQPCTDEVCYQPRTKRFTITARVR